MESLKKERVDMLMQIVSDQYPSQQILHISDAENDLHKHLFELTKKREFEYDLRYVTQSTPEIPDPHGHPGCTVEFLDLKKRAYNKHAKLYEYVFVTVSDEIIDEEIVQILKKIYRVMKNAGVLVLVLKRDGSLQKRIDQLLEEGYFVAVNHIDILDGFDVVNARKMHGWGAYSVGF